jgi:hypothetical protein
MTQWNRLLAPFPARDIEWRVQSCGEKNGKVWAIVLAYVTARAIQARLDEVFGPAGWKNEYRQGPDGGVLCRIYFRDDDGEWVWREDGAENTDVEAVKGGISGALKRAGSALGIGRYLYNLTEGFAVISERGAHRGRTKEGTSFKWDPPPLPSWALPGNDSEPLATDEQRSELTMLGDQIGGEAPVYVAAVLAATLTHDTADKELRKLRKRLEKAGAA